MIHLTIEDVRHLYFSCEPIGIKCHGTINCSVCQTIAVCSALSWATSAYIDGAKHEEIERTIHAACVSFRDYTDKVCDTYACPHCPNYSWCTTLRGIAIEGVKLDEY